MPQIALVPKPLLPKARALGTVVILSSAPGLFQGEKQVKEMKGRIPSDLCSSKAGYPPVLPILPTSVAGALGEICCHHWATRKGGGEPLLFESCTIKVRPPQQWPARSRSTVPSLRGSMDPQGVGASQVPEGCLAEPIHPGRAHLMKRKEQQTLHYGTEDSQTTDTTHGLQDKVHISSHGPEPFSHSPACFSRVMGSHTLHASSCLMDECCDILLPGHACSFIFFSLRLVISLYLANGHTLSPTKLLL